MRPRTLPIARLGEIDRLAEAGHSQAEIAAALNISRSQVGYYRSRIGRARRKQLEAALQKPAA